jgi:hypothetical protein
MIHGLDDVLIASKPCSITLNCFGKYDYIKEFDPSTSERIVIVLKKKE